jgi:uncharacterized membrane protein (UPF0127 family)
LNKNYKVKVAITEEEQEKGLQNVKNLPENEGMLFIVDDEDIGIWMKDTYIPLDIIFINEDLEVIKVQEGIPKSEEIIYQKDSPYILEVNANSGIKVGDELDLNSDSKERLDKMFVLDENGDPQMILEGGERIFSRKDTKILIKFAKKAALTKKDSDYKALGKRVFKFLEKQDSNEAEYVELKK